MKIYQVWYSRSNSALLSTETKCYGVYSSKEEAQRAYYRCYRKCKDFEEANPDTKVQYRVVDKIYENELDTDVEKISN